jgi:hypothetical protein
VSLGGWLRRRWYLLRAGWVADACAAPAGCDELARWRFREPGGDQVYAFCTTHAADQALTTGLVPMSRSGQPRSAQRE